MNSRFRTFVFALVSVALLYVPLMNGVEQSLGIDGALVGTGRFELYKLFTLCFGFFLGTTLQHFVSKPLRKRIFVMLAGLLLLYLAIGLTADEFWNWGVTRHTFGVTRWDMIKFRFPLLLGGYIIGIPFFLWIKERYDQPDILKLLRD